MGKVALMVRSELERAKNLSRMQRHTEAIELLNEVIREQPAEVDAYFQRGLAKDALGDHDSAIADLDFAIGLDPTQPALLYFRGRFHVEASRYAEGIEDMDRTIAADLALGSEYYASSARFISAIALLLAGDAKGAREACVGLAPNQNTYIAGRLWALSDLEQGRLGRKPGAPR